MLEFRDVPDSNVIEFTVDGHIARDEFERVIAALNANIAEHGKVRLLEEIRSFGLTDPLTLLEDLKWLFEHFNDIERTAVVSDYGWLEGFVQMTSPMFKMPAVSYTHLTLPTILRVYLSSRSAVVTIK